MEIARFLRRRSQGRGKDPSDLVQASIIAARYGKVRLGFDPLRVRVDRDQCRPRSTALVIGYCGLNTSITTLFDGSTTWSEFPQML
jgi:hypothetical protein